MTSFTLLKKALYTNYADDNTLSFHHNNFETLMSVLTKESTILIKWFTDNCMQANPSKFQAIAVGSKTFNKHPVFNIDTANRG